MYSRIQMAFPGQRHSETDQRDVWVKFIPRLVNAPPWKILVEGGTVGVPARSWVLVVMLQLRRGRRSACLKH
jgi:hypothetical protein